MFRVQFPDKHLTGQFGLAVDVLRSRDVELGETDAGLPLEDVIGRHLDDLRVDALSGHREVAGSQGIDLERFDHIFLTFIHVRHAGTVDDHGRVVDIDGGVDGGQVRDVHFILIGPDDFVLDVLAEKLDERAAETTFCTGDPDRIFGHKIHSCLT